jgi:hypothetical protein
MNIKSFQRSGAGVVRMSGTVMKKKMALNHEEITKLA